MAAPEMDTTVATAAPTTLDMSTLQTVNDTLKLMKLPVELTDRIDARLKVLQSSHANPEAALHEARVLTLLASAIGYHHDSFLTIHLILMGYATNGEHGTKFLIDKSGSEREHRLHILYNDKMSKPGASEIPLVVFLAAHNFYYDETIEHAFRMVDNRWLPNTLEELDALVAALDAVEAVNPVVPDPTRGWGGSVFRSGGAR